MIGENEEKTFILGLKKGKVQSFDAIFKRYNKRVYYFALSYLKDKDEAEDVVQEVFMNLWKFRDQINEYYIFSKYLFKITYNVTCKKFRKHASDKKHIEEVLNSFSLEDNSTKLDVEYNNLYEFTNKLINELPARQKEILLININEHLEVGQIAEKLNISKKTVENYLAMARGTLKNALGKAGILPVLFIYLFL
jgi:RNA polymerase sigma-70 factor (ECF subfamily)